MTTTTDISDLIPEEAALVRRMLQEIALYPQIREPMLRFLLAEDFPALVALVRENSDNIRLILERLSVVEEAVVRTDRAVRVLQGQVGALRGTSYEDRCREQIAAVLDGYLARAVPADRERINTLLVNARHAGQITRAELIDGYNADIIARAMDDDAETVILAVVEVSVTFNRQDLEIAARRAELIGRIAGAPTAAYLATQHDWPDAMNIAAADLDVTIISYPLDDFAEY